MHKSAILTFLAIALLLLGNDEHLYGEPTCYPAILNGACEIELNSTGPVAPLPIRLKAGAKVTIKVNQTAGEKITFDATYSDAETADIGATIFEKFSPTFAALELKSGSLGGSGLSEALRTHPLWNELKAISANQEEEIGKMNSVYMPSMKAAVNALEALSSAATESHFGTDKKVFEEKVGPGVCNASGTALWQALCPLPSSRLLGERISNVLKQILALPTGNDDEKKIREEIEGTFRLVEQNQRLLELSLKDLRDAQDLLFASGLTVKRLEPKYVSCMTYEPGPSKDSGASTAACPSGSAKHTDSKKSEGLDRIAEVAISSTNIFTKKKKPLVTVKLRWTGGKWEVSVGTLFSALADRKFANAPIITDGEPQRDDKGINTRITESMSKPAVVPTVFAHFRLAETSYRGRRLGVMLTGGLGVNPFTSTADLAAGFSLVYRRFAISPLAHFGRDTRLTSGLGVGQELGSSPPVLPTERFWTGKLAIGISYTLPIN